MVISSFRIMKTFRVEKGCFFLSLKKLSRPQNLRSLKTLELSDVSEPKEFFYVTQQFHQTLKALLFCFLALSVFHCFHCPFYV